MEMTSKKVLTRSAVRQIVDAAQEEARRNDVRVTVAVLDDGGHLLELSRMDGVHSGTVDVAIAKAKTAVLFRQPTRNFAEALGKGVQAILSLPGMLPLPGGEPFLVEGVLVGSIGISGASPDMDGQIAQAGAALTKA